MKKNSPRDKLRTWTNQNKNILLFFALVVVLIILILWMTNRAMTRIENEALGMCFMGLSSLTFRKIFQSNK